MRFTKTNEWSQVQVFWRTKYPVAFLTKPAAPRTLNKTKALPSETDQNRKRLAAPLPIISKLS